MQYQEVKVQFKTTDDKGKTKRENRNYLVDAQSPTEAEARITEKLLGDEEQDFEVKATKESKIVEVVERIEKGK